MMTTKRVSPQQLKAMLHDDGELALVDVREAGQFGESHPLFATPVPYSRLEIDILALVPRQSARIVLCDEDTSAFETRHARGTTNNLPTSLCTSVVDRKSLVFRCGARFAPQPIGLVGKVRDFPSTTLEFHGARSPQTGLPRTIRPKRRHPARTVVRRRRAQGADFHSKIASSAVFLRRAGKRIVYCNL